MTSQITAPYPSRRARREAERAAERVAVKQSRLARNRAERAQRAAGPLASFAPLASLANLTDWVPPRFAAMATVGGLAVGLPLAGLVGSGVTPAFASTSSVAAADTTVLQTLNEASATAETEGGARATSLTIDDAGKDRARIVAATNELPAQVCADPTAANGALAAIAPSAENAVVSPLDAGTYLISSTFGPRIHPIFGVGRMHNGDDYAAPAGTPIKAVAAGTVIHSGANIGQPGTLVIIEHELDGETWTSWYLHMYAKDIVVKEGQKVLAGDLVGLVGSAGNSTGPHLHLEIHQGAGKGGKPVNPAQWLAERGAANVSQPC